MKKVYFFIILSALFVFSFLLDKQLLNLINSIRNPILTKIMIFLSTITGTFQILMLIFLVFVWTKKSRALMPSLIFSLALSALTVFILKSVISRPRPEIIHLTTETDSSFPSGHSNSVFSVYPIINKNYKKLSLIWLTFSVLVAFSRIYLGVHYLSDVIFGAIIGLFFGNLVIYLEQKYNIFKLLKNK